MSTHDSAEKTPSAARARILSTAHDLFYRDGIRATGIDRVIADAGVTKVTFYRHFPSKNDLVLAFLEHRHDRWMAWFQGALDRHRDLGPQALVPSLGEWFTDPAFRGCAFLNSVAEVGGSMPEVREIARTHKEDMVQTIAGLLPASATREEDARAIGVAVDGAMLHAQFGDAATALAPLERVIWAIVARQR